MKARCALWRTFVVLAAALSANPADGAVVSFSWQQNTEPDLAGYKLYYGPSSRNYTNHIVLGKVTRHTISNLVEATHYFALVAFNTNDVDSAMSAELRYPNGPTLAALSNLSIAEDSIATLPLHVTDIDTPAANLTLTATSSNLVLLPEANINFSGTGTNRTMQITPAPNRSGTSAITVRVTDASGLSATRSFILTVSGVGDAPTISAIGDVTTDEDVETELIPFTVADAETAATSLTVRALSSNAALIPTNRIVLGGSGASRTVRLRPTTNQYGSATITLIVRDATLSSSNTFTFNVLPVNDGPTISQITDRNLLEDTQTNPLAFTVNDVDNPKEGLTVTASSSDEAIVPNELIFLGGTGSNRNVIIRPATNVVGSAVITLTVSDGSLSASKSFGVTYLAVNDLPFVSDPGDLVVNKQHSVPPIPFAVWDVETAPGSLRISLTSSNTSLLRSSDITVSGTGTNRTLMLSPRGNQVGTTRVGIHVSDNAATNRVFFQFTVTGSNNPPVLKVPGNLAGDAGSLITVQGITVSDLDAGTNNLTMTISAANGTLALATSITGGVKATQVTGNNSGALTMVAPLDCLNATLTNARGLTYTSRADFGGTETLVVTVSDNGYSGTGGVQTDTDSISIQVAGQDNLAGWRASYFNASDLQDPTKEATVWGDLADPDNDGRHNLMEFALGLNPLGSEPQESTLVSATITSGGNQYLTLTFNARINEPLLQYIVEVSPDASVWSAAAQRVANTPVSPEFERVTYRDTVPITSQAARFIRLRVVKNSP